MTATDDGALRPFVVNVYELRRFVVTVLARTDREARELALAEVRHDGYTSVVTRWADVVEAGE